MTQLGRVACRPPCFTFGGSKYFAGETYGFDDLPPVTRRDVLSQAEDLEARFGHDPRTLLFHLVVIPRESLEAELRSRYGTRLEDALSGEDVQDLARSIERHGLQYPPVGEEGWKRALAAFALGMDLPYFEVVEPFEMPEPEFIPSLEGRKKKESPKDALPPQMAKEIRLGFWRMVQRVGLGIPGFVGSGRVDVDGAQFVGGLAGMNTAWLLKPHQTRFFETVPIVGFYLFGQYWPKVIHAIEVRKGKHDNLSKMVERLEKEFGLTPEEDLLKGTIPYTPRKIQLPPPKAKKTAMGSPGAPTRVKPWTRCGNTLFWRWAYAPTVDQPITVHLAPIDLVEVIVDERPAGLPEGSVLFVQRSIPEAIPHGWTSEEFNAAMERISPLLSGAVAVWFTSMGTMENQGASKTDVLAQFVRTTQARRNAVLTGLEELFESGALQATERRRLVILEGSPAHSAILDAEATAAVTEPTVVAPEFDLGAVVDEVLSSYGVIEC